MTITHHHHYCVHCKNLGGIAPGHPMNREMDAYKHVCPHCLRVWWSNDDAIHGIKTRAKLYNPTKDMLPTPYGLPPRIVQGVGRGSGYNALARMRPNIKRF